MSCRAARNDKQTSSWIGRFFYVCQHPAQHRFREESSIDHDRINALGVTNIFERVCFEQDETGDFPFFDSAERIRLSKKCRRVNRCRL
jgi:hypothetical protein